MCCVLLLDHLMFCFSDKLEVIIGLHFYVVESRWEEERYTDGVKWKFLEHKGPVFAPPYEPLPSHVKFYYDGMRIFCNEYLTFRLFGLL